MTIELEKLLKEAKVNLINCTLNFKLESSKNNTEEDFIKDLININDADRDFNNLISFIQKKIGYNISLKAIKDILNLEAQFFMNLENGGNGKPL
mgnify:CR=1 FL=1